MKAKLFSTQFLGFFFIISSFLSTNLLGFALPANDDCANAIELTGLFTCSSIYIDATDATSANNTNGCN